jgi:hypothetical protein
MRKSLKKVTLISAIIISLVVLFLLIVSLDTRQNNKLDTIAYDVYISTEDSVEYLIRIPVIVDVNGTISDMNFNFELIRGNASWLIEDTVYGKMISINGSGDVWLKAIKEVNVNYFETTGIHPEGMDDFNLCNSTDQDKIMLGKVCIELNVTSMATANIDLTLDLNLGNIHHRADKTNLMVGWQQLAVRYEAVLP